MNAIINSLHLAVALIAMWFLYFCCWREYKVDSFRQSLFAVRDDLFDYADSGRIDFNDPAYTLLRNLINGLIRFAHRLTFARVLILVVTGQSNYSPMEYWTKDIRRLPSDVQQKLMSVHGEIVKALAKQVILWSPIGLIVSGISIAVSFVVHTFKLRVKTVHRPDKEVSSILEGEVLEQPSNNEQCLAVG